ncbi:hypothetical protein PLICRDRAFT_37857 [Plicaturopsis crispa FD-325 SS-3]|nr:hypothetical protein PLICRDRAFT_37857 [Plicaturopsis crispa FD-325 SS-3]
MLRPDEHRIRCSTHAPRIATKGSCGRLLRCTQVRANKWARSSALYGTGIAQTLRADGPSRQDLDVGHREEVDLDEIARSTEQSTYADGIHTCLRHPRTWECVPLFHRDGYLYIAMLGVCSEDLGGAENWDKVLTGGVEQGK